MEIEREWGQSPGWFSDQPIESQVRLLAWRRVKVDPSGQHFKPAKKSTKDFWGTS